MRLWAIVLVWSGFSGAREPEHDNRTEAHHVAWHGSKGGMCASCFTKQVSLKRKVPRANPLEGPAEETADLLQSQLSPLITPHGEASERSVEVGESSCQNWIVAGTDAT
jgi:hypothetical protein